jgi:hypothetical protein
MNLKLSTAKNYVNIYSIRGQKNKANLIFPSSACYVLRKGKLKKQSQFIRSAYCVLRAAKRHVEKTKPICGGMN